MKVVRWLLLDDDSHTVYRKAEDVFCKDLSPSIDVENAAVHMCHIVGDASGKESSTIKPPPSRFLAVI